MSQSIGPIPIVMETHSHVLCEQLQQLRNQNGLLDLDIMCEEHHINVHKVVMAAGSRFFKDQLCKQNVQAPVILRLEDFGIKLKMDAVTYIIEFVYRGEVTIPGDKLTEVCAAAHSLGVIGLTDFLPVPAETQLPALISKEPLQIAEEVELRVADEDSYNNNSNTDPKIIPISFSNVVAGPGDMASVPLTQQLYPSATDSGEQYRIIPEIPSDGTFHEETLQQSPVAADVSLPMSGDHQTSPSLVFSSPGSSQNQPSSAEEGLISQEETDQATQFLLQENCDLQGGTILPVNMAEAGQPLPSLLSSPSPGGVDPDPGEGGGGAGLSAAGDGVMMEADDTLFSVNICAVNSNTGDGIMMEANDSGEQYGIPEILSDGTFHEETRDTQELSSAEAQFQDHQYHSAVVNTLFHNNPGHLRPGHGKIKVQLSQVFSSPGSGQKQPSSEEGLISQEETDRATQFLLQNCGLQGGTILPVGMAGAGQSLPSVLSSPSLGAVDSGPGAGGGGAGLSAAGDGVMMEADYTVNSNTDPNLIPISFSDSVVAGPGDMVAVCQTQQLYPTATDSGEQYRIIPKILSDGTFHEETIDSCFSLIPGPVPAPGDTQELSPAKAQSQDQHHSAGVKTPVHNNLGHLRHGHDKTEQQQQPPVAANLSLPMSGDHQEDASMVANSAAELPKSAVSCPSLVFSSPGSSQKPDNPAEEPLNSTVIPTQKGPFTKLVRGEIGYDLKSLNSFRKKDENLHPEEASETMVNGRHRPKNHDNPAEEPLDSTIIPSQDGPFTKLVRGKIGYDFKSLKSFQKKDEPSEISRTVGIQTEETGIQRKKRSPYTLEEIEEGLQILLSSTRTYKLLLQKQKETGCITLRLPSVQTCRVKIRSFLCPPGLNHEMLFLMAKKFESLPSTKDKNCVLSCDEMDLYKKWSYDQRLKRLFPPHKKVQVCQLRGLRLGYTFTFYYDFDVTMDLQLLRRIVIATEEAGGFVRAICCDMGNTKLLAQLDVYNGKFQFPNPVRADSSVYVMCDVVHMIKLLRNHIFDHGLTFTDEDGSVVTITKEDFWSLIAEDGSPHEIRKLYKIGPRHLNCHYSERQRVKLAVQILSMSVSNAFQMRGEEKKAEIIKTIDEWFDVCDSRSKYHKWKKVKCALGVHEELQMAALDKMLKLMDNVSFGPNTNKKHFIKGIRCSTNSLKALYHELREERWDYLISYRLNQDKLEHKFAVYRASGGNNNHPRAADFCHRFRYSAVFSNTDSIVSKCTAVEDTGCEDEPAVSANLSGRVFSALCEVDEEDEGDHGSELPDDQSEDFRSSEETDYEDMPPLILKSKQGLQYVSGYIAKRLNMPVRQSAPGSWINLQGKKLVRAEEQLEEQVRMVDREFDMFHGTKLRAGQDIKQKTIDFILGRECCGEIPRAVVEIFTNIKFFYRIKYLNLHEIDEKTSKTRKSARDLKKNIHNQF